MEFTIEKQIQVLEQIWNYSITFGRDGEHKVVWMSRNSNTQFEEFLTDEGISSLVLSNEGWLETIEHMEDKLWHLNFSGEGIWFYKSDGGLTGQNTRTTILDPTKRGKIATTHLAALETLSE